MLKTHQPVLLDQVIKYLSPKAGESFLDATAGYGGHAQAVNKLIQPGGTVTLIDRDKSAVKALREKFGQTATIIREDYEAAMTRLVEDGSSFDLILFDLGVSSPQLDDPERGFSFKSEHELDMRMDRRQALTAREVVNTYTPSSLAQIIAKYGEEPRASKIAQAIVASRPIQTTKGLADVVHKAKGYQRGRIDAATRTFQAIRIEVNNELHQLEAALPLAVKLLNPGGRLAVISFHSLEDRIVKQFFRHESQDCICPPEQPVCTCDHVATLKMVNVKTEKGSNQNVFNPRARSAKFRVACKIKTKRRRP